MRGDAATAATRIRLALSAPDARVVQPLTFFRGSRGSKHLGEQRSSSRRGARRSEFAHDGNRLEAWERKPIKYWGFIRSCARQRSAGRLNECVSGDRFSRREIFFARTATLADWLYILPRAENLSHHLTLHTRCRRGAEVKSARVRCQSRCQSIMTRAANGGEVRHSRRFRTGLFVRSSRVAARQADGHPSRFSRARGGTPGFAAPLSRVPLARAISHVPGVFDAAPLAMIANLPARDASSQHPRPAPHTPRGRR